MADVGLTLTFDELTVLCGTLDLQLPVGVIEDEYEYPPEVVARLRAAATAALHTRGITDGVEATAVNSAVRTLLEIASEPALIASVERDTGDDVRVAFLLCDADLGVQVEALVPAAYQLTPFVTRDLMSRIVRISDLRPADVPDVPPLSIARDDLELCGEAASSSPGRAGDGLRSVGVPEPAASAFGAALAERRASIGVTILHRPTDELIEGGTLSWIDAGLLGNWLSDATEATSDDDQLVIRAVNAPEIVEQLLSFLPGAFSDDGGDEEDGADHGSAAGSGSASEIA